MEEISSDTAHCLDWKLCSVSEAMCLHLQEPEQGAYKIGVSPYHQMMKQIRSKFYSRRGCTLSRREQQGITHEHVS
jgi:hypothetical protein